MNGATVETLERRLAYGGRKGRRARLRLRRMGILTYPAEVYFDGVHLGRVFAWHVKRRP